MTSLSLDALMKKQTTLGHGFIAEGALVDTSSSSTLQNFMKSLEKALADHKAFTTLNTLWDHGSGLGIHFEDDPIQADIIEASAQSKSSAYCARPS
jgi:ABC-type phosphate transport system substrate-binding protein